MSDRLVISRDGAWQIGDEVSSLGGGGNTLSIDTGSIAAGKAVYIDASGDAQLADNSALSTSEVVGFVSSQNTVTYSGVVSGFSSLTPGSTYFLGVDGDISLSPPTADDSVVVRVGKALTANSLLIDIDVVAVL